MGRLLHSGLRLWATVSSAFGQAKAGVRPSRPLASFLAGRVPPRHTTANEKHQVGLRAPGCALVARIGQDQGRILPARLGGWLPCAWLARKCHADLPFGTDGYSAWPMRAGTAHPTNRRVDCCCRDRDPARDGERSLVAPGARGQQPRKRRTGVRPSGCAGSAAGSVSERQTEAHRMSGSTMTRMAASASVTEPEPSTILMRSGSSSARRR